MVSADDEAGPEQEALLADSVGLALLVVLETLTPAERLAFVLHDMFALPFEEIAPIVGRTPVATRQLASRARRRVQGAAPHPDANLAEQRRLVDAFLAAARATSTRSSPCSIQTSSSVPTEGRCPRPRASRRSLAVAPRWPSTC
jgi:hypothetical protein